MQAENNSKRLALVIGNSFYGNFSELKNSKKDADDMKAKLELLGFAVDNDPFLDRSHLDMLQDISGFAKRIHHDVTDIVFYYAGHGCSIQGENFLVPIDGLSPEDSSTASQTYIRLDWLINLVAKSRPPDVPIIFIVDCCRTEVANGQPLHGDPIKTTAALPNVFIMYATANGHVAVDGEEGGNGVFTERLLEYLDTDMTVVEISKRIAKDLKGKQTHWISSSMYDDYRFRHLPKEQTKVFANAEMIKVPFRQNNYFIGRADILEEMEQKLRHNQLTGKCVPLALSGLGGMGKTQLMLQYHHTHCNEYKAVFWLNAEGMAAVMDMFRLLAETLGIKMGENEKGDLDGMLADRIREILESRKDRWLLLLDNVETVSDVSRFIPNKGGDVIVTTRDHVDRRWGSVIHVDKMSKDDALLLLVGPENQSAPSDLAVEIIEELDRMPLAIDIVRAYIERTGVTLKSYLKMYKTKNAILLYNMKDANLEQYKNTIATVWDVSLGKIRDQNKLAELILSNCAILQPDTIPVFLFEQQATMLSLEASAESINDAIGVLTQFSFARRAVRRDVNTDVNRDDDGDSRNDIIVIHRLVQAVIRDICMQRNDLWRICERVIAAFDNEIVTGDCYDPQVRRTYALYLPHIREIVRLVDWRQMDVKSQSLLGKLISRTVWHYIEFGQGYQSLFSLANIGLLISEESNGSEHPDTASSLYNLASLFKSQAKYNESEPLYQRALAIREVLGPDLPETAQSMNGLANLYKVQAKYDLAKPLYQRALAIREVLGPDLPEMAQSMNGLANLYNGQGKYDLAKPLYQRALAIREKVLGPDHPQTATSMKFLANLYSDQGKYDLASPLYHRASAIYEKALGPDHPDMAIILNNLAALYYNQGKYDLAEPLYQRASAIGEKALGQDHPDMARSLHNLAVIYVEQHNYNKASSLFQQSLTIKEKALGPDHPSTAISLAGLADCYHEEGKNELAEPLYLRALAIFEKVLGPDHPDMASPLNNLALLYSNQGKYDKAEPLYQRTLAIDEKVLDPDHPGTARTLNNLANLRKKQSKQDHPGMQGNSDNLTNIHSTAKVDGALAVLKRGWRKITRAR